MGLSHLYHVTWETPTFDQFLGPHHHPPTPSPTSSNSPLISWFTNPPDYSYNHHKPNNSTSPHEIPPNLTKSSQPFFPGNIPECHQNQPCPAPPSGALGPGGRPTHARARDGGRRPGAQRRHRRRRPAGSGRRGARLHGGGTEREECCQVLTGMNSCGIVTMVRND